MRVSSAAVETLDVILMLYNNDGIIVATWSVPKRDDVFPMNRSFLFQVCDYHLNYLGCDNVSEFVSVDAVLFIMHLISTVLFFGFLAFRVSQGVKQGQKLKNLFNDIDYVVLFGGMAHICRTTMVSNLRSIQYVDIASMTDSDAQAYLRTSLIMELLANVTGSFALTGFVNAMVKTATAADLFQPFVFRDRIIDPKTPLLVYRITVLLIVIVTSSLLCTIGITRSYSEYLLYRRVFYGMFTIISFCCSMPLAAFFGLKVFTAFLKMPDAQELSVTINTVTGSQVSPASDNSQSRPNRIWIPSPTNNSKKSKLFTLRLSIYGVVLMYGFAGAYLSSVIWINETFSHDHRSLLYAKIVLDAFLFIYYSWYTGSW